MEKGHRTIAIISGTLLMLGVGFNPVQAVEDHYQMAMGNVINSYLKIRERLAADSLEGVTTEAQRIIQQAKAAEKMHTEHSRHSHDIHEKYQLISNAGKYAAHLAHGDIKAVRAHFLKLSKPIIKYVEKFGQPHNLTGELFTYYCPMYPGYWVQEDKNAGNPFYGSKMLKCAQLIEGQEKKQAMLHDLSKKELKLEKKHPEEHHPGH